MDISWKKRSTKLLKGFISVNMEISCVELIGKCIKITV